MRSRKYRRSLPIGRYRCSNIIMTFLWWQALLTTDFIAINTRPLNCGLVRCNAGESTYFVHILILCSFSFDFYSSKMISPSREREVRYTVHSTYCLFGMKIREWDGRACNLFPVRNIWTSLYLCIALLLVYAYIKFRHTKMRRGKRYRRPHYGVLFFGSDGSDLSASYLGSVSEIHEA